MHYQKLALTAVITTIAMLSIARADVVDVKYWGPVDLVSFDCMSISRSSLVTRVCYLEKKSYLVVGLKNVYYHYCDIEAGTVRDFLAASSMGTFYNASITDSGTRGRFSCKDKTPPTIN